MRISCKTDDPGYTSQAWAYQVKLDGVLLGNCLTADEEKGEVLVWLEPEEMAAEGSETGLRYGDVKIIRDLGVKPAAPPARPQELTVNLGDIQVSTDVPMLGGQGGLLFSWTCPECGVDLAWSPNCYGVVECGCREWEFNIKAVGTLKRRGL